MGKSPSFDQHHPHAPQHAHRRGSTDHLPSSSHSAAIVSDRKAIVNLASIVLAFAICWIPYFVLFTLKPFVDLPLSSGFGYHFDLFALWLGYANSSINPFLYAFYSTSFRNGFRRLLCSRWGRNRNESFAMRSGDGDWDCPRGATAAGNGKSSVESRTRWSAEDSCGNGLGVRAGLCLESAKSCEGESYKEGSKTSIRTGSLRMDHEKLRQTGSIDSKTLQRTASEKGIETGRGCEQQRSSVECQRNGEKRGDAVPCRRYVLLRCFEANKQRRRLNFITLTQRTTWNQNPNNTKVSVV